MSRFLLFWLSAILLFCNDFIWKNSFHNTFTGKLSDIAGLSLWVLFWEAWLPVRFRLYLYLLSAVAFAWFKSPLSDTFLTVFHLGRVVDYTDLWALLVFVPLYFLPKTSFQTPKTWQPTLVGSVIALFLFGATSRGPEPPIVYEDRIVMGFKMQHDSALNFLGKKFHTGKVFTQLDTIHIQYTLNDSLFYKKYNNIYAVILNTTTRASGKDSTTFILHSIQIERNSSPAEVDEAAIYSAVEAMLRKELKAL
jgi:hypothetical protein